MNLEVEYLAAYPVVGFQIKIVAKGGPDAMPVLVGHVLREHSHGQQDDKPFVDIPCERTLLGPDPDAAAAWIRTVCRAQRDAEATANEKREQLEKQNREAYARLIGAETTTSE